MKRTKKGGMYLETGCMSTMMSTTCMHSRVIAVMHLLPAYVCTNHCYTTNNLVASCLAACTQLCDAVVHLLPAYVCTNNQVGCIMLAACWINLMHCTTKLVQHAGWLAVVNKCAPTCWCTIGWIIYMCMLTP